MYKISFFVPESHLELVKSAMFRAGAGRIGNYEECSFEVKGKGQFRALRGSNPFIGETGIIEYVDEYKVELVCSKKYLKDVMQAFKLAHPYETPAFDIIKLEKFVF